jgi:hypothetical protein
MGELFGKRQSSGRVAVEATAGRLAGRVYHYAEPPSDNALGEYWESNSVIDKYLGESVQPTKLWASCCGESLLESYSASKLLGGRVARQVIGLGFGTVSTYVEPPGDKKSPS